MPVRVGWTNANTTTTGTFKPTDIPGCVLWLRSDLGITKDLFTNLISKWKDQSGKENDAVAGGGFISPTWVEVENIPIIDFPATAGLEFGSLGDSFTTTGASPTSITSFAVLKAQDSSQVETDIFWFIGNGADKDLYINDGIIEYDEDDDNGNQLFFSSDDPVDFSNWSILEFVVNSPSLQGYTINVLQNGIPISGGFSGLVAFTGQTFSSATIDNYSDSGPDVYYTEVIIYNVVVSNNNRSRIRTYLQDRYTI